MVKKILIASIAALFCLLIGLLVLFFYFNFSVNKKNSILVFIPNQVQFVLKVKKTSVTTNAFLTNSIVNNCFQINEIASIWKSIDSVSSRNYKTADILATNTSYICADSLGHYLVLIDLNKKTNEHFIDQFLVNSTGLRKIQKFKEGYKAFFPQAEKSVFYFVKQNVFGVSLDEELLLSAFNHGITETAEPHIQQWDQSTNGDIAFLALNNIQYKVFTQFGADFLLSIWPTRSANINLVVDQSSLLLQGTIQVDSSKMDLSWISNDHSSGNMFIYQTDTGSFDNWFYRLQIPDSIGKPQPISFVYSTFIDSGGIPSFLLVSQSSISQYIYQRTSLDTATQIIPMADENIQHIAVFNPSVLSHVLPIPPIVNDSSKLFATWHNGALFIAKSTETILMHATNYPTGNFIKKKLDGSVLLYHFGLIKFAKPYLVESSYRSEGQNAISFTSEIKPIGSNK